MEDDDETSNPDAGEELEVEDAGGGMIRMRVFGGEVEVPVGEIDTPLEGEQCSLLFVASGELR